MKNKIRIYNITNIEKTKQQSIFTALILQNDLKKYRHKKKLNNITLKCLKK